MPARPFNDGRIGSFMFLIINLLKVFFKSKHMYTVYQKFKWAVVNALALPDCWVGLFCWLCGFCIVEEQITLKLSIIFICFWIKSRNNKQYARYKSGVWKQQSCWTFSINNQTGFRKSVIARLNCIVFLYSVPQEWAILASSHSFSQPFVEVKN